MASTDRQAVARGDVWLIALDPVIGSEQSKTRPCVVMQRDAQNMSSPTTIVVPFGSAEGMRIGPVTPVMQPGDGGLPRKSVALCNQVRVVDRLRLRRRLGSLSVPALETIGHALRLLLDLE